MKQGVSQVSVRAARQVTMMGCCTEDLSVTCRQPSGELTDAHADRAMCQRDRLQVHFLAAPVTVGPVDTWTFWPLEQGSAEIIEVVGASSGEGGLGGGLAAVAGTTAAVAAAGRNFLVGGAGRAAFRCRSWRFTQTQFIDTVRSSWCEHRQEPTGVAVLGPGCCRARVMQRQVLEGCSTSTRSSMCQCLQSCTSCVYEGFYKTFPNVLRARAIHI